MANFQTGMTIASSPSNDERSKPPFLDKSKKTLLWPQIIIVDENPTRRSAVSAVVAQRHIDVIYGMSSIYECLAQLEEVKCTLILASANLPAADISQLFKHVHAMPIKVIVTDVPNDPQQILTYIAAGAEGYVLADEEVEVWAEQIDAVRRRQPVVSPAVVAAMMKHLAMLSRLIATIVPRYRQDTSLTEREHETLLLLGDGLCNQAIAARMTITVGTVKNHVHNILKKLNLSDRKAAENYISHFRKSGI